MIVRLLVLLAAALVAVLLVKIVLAVAFVAVALCAGLYVYRFACALGPAASLRRGRRVRARLRGVRPLLQPRISMRR